MQPSTSWSAFSSSIPQRGCLSVRRAFLLRQPRYSRSRSQTTLSSTPGSPRPLPTASPPLLSLSSSPPFPSTPAPLLLPIISPSTLPPSPLPLFQALSATRCFTRNNSVRFSFRSSATSLTNKSRQPPSRRNPRTIHDRLQPNDSRPERRRRCDDRARGPVGGRNDRWTCDADTRGGRVDGRGVPFVGGEEEGPSVGVLVFFFVGGEERECDVDGPAFVAAVRYSSLGRRGSHRYFSVEGEAYEGTVSKATGGGDYAEAESEDERTA